MTPGMNITSLSVGVAADPPLPLFEEVPTPELTDRTSLCWSAMEAARVEAESSCSSSLELVELLPPLPVLVSEMELPEEKGGRDRSDSEGEAGLRMKDPVRGDSTRLRVSYCSEPQSDIVRANGAPDTRRRGLYLGASLKGTEISHCQSPVFLLPQISVKYHEFFFLFIMIDVKG